jgi:hypothetical protein
MELVTRLNQVAHADVRVKDSAIGQVHSLDPSYAEAIEVALFWGWIDGQKQGHDERHWLQKFTPRGARSLWSKIHRDKASDARFVRPFACFTTRSSWATVSSSPRRLEIQNQS